MALPHAPHLLVEATPESAPTRPLLMVLAGNWFADSRTVDARDAATRDRLPVLRVTPHPDLDACGHAAVHLAYTVRWSIPVPARQQVLPPAAPWPAPAQDDDEADEADNLGWHDLTPAQTLLAEPMPPAHLDALREQRLTEADHAADTDDLTGFTPQQLRLLGGPDGARRLLRDRGRASAGRTEWTERADWTALADRLETLRSAAPPKLTPVQRLALAGAARIILAQRQEANTQSLRDLTGHILASTALGPGDTAALGALTRQTLNTWHPASSRPDRT
ncbi:hypothetical protein [Actinacidiphila sp. ITFR-21]|uniref:hypothetical protein n=1 Tax=Actinacidiphila sp. ITFR-21 TaxID=3075199 RepID=UPI00288BEAA9|nr:hypothetical protein [Streptomyces sp. ITFR-21]WNI19983.1 hypothetical protein RLT57_31065 [Streptomyces sp. ITFR-21]